MITDEHISFHGTDAMAHRPEQLYAEEQRVARHNLMTELHVIDLEEIGRPLLGFVELAEHEQSTALCHGLDLQHAGHDGLA